MQERKTKLSHDLVAVLSSVSSEQSVCATHLLLYRLLHVTSASLCLAASPMLLHPLYPKGQNNSQTHNQSIPQHTLYNRMSPGGCFWLPLWPFKLGVDPLKVLLLSAVEDSAGLTQQLWLGHVQPQPVWEDLERKVGVPHGLTITINLQEKKRVHLSHQFNGKQLIRSN